MLKTLKLINGPVTMLSIVGLVILMLAGGYAWATKQVERPYSEEGYIIAFIDISHVGEGYARWYAFGSGHATHLGTLTSYTAGVNNFVTGENTGTGWQAAANGDKIFLHTVATNEGVLGGITGGTGRFEGITSGEGGVQMHNPEDEIWEVLVPNETMIMMYPYTTEGTIRY